MIIFDLDGTLWETVETTLIAANIVTKKYTELKTIEKETIIKGMGLSSEENVKNYMPYINKEQGLKYLKEISEINFKLISERGAHVFDNVEKTIKELNKKYKLGIITNNHDGYVEEFFKITKLKKYFIDYMGTASYNITKSEAIKKMVQKYNEPINFYVGDIKKDKIAAEQADTIFIHAKYGFEPSLKTKYYIAKIEDLIEIIKKINY